MGAGVTFLFLVLGPLFSALTAPAHTIRLTPIFVHCVPGIVMLCIQMRLSLGFLAVATSVRAIKRRLVVESMLLSDAIQAAECSICLQPLLSDAQLSQSPNQSPQKGDGFQITFSPSVSRVYPGEDILALLYTHGMHQRASKETHKIAADASRSGSSSGGCGDGCSSVGAHDLGIVVLSCGHLLHYTCITQLFEYKKEKACPICRRELKGDADVVRFAPRVRPTPADQYVELDEKETECKSNADTTNISSMEDVQFTGERRVTAVDTYNYRIQCEAADLKQRRRNIRDRERDLTRSRDQLEDQCLTLEQLAGEARRRHDVLTQHGKFDVDRLVELRNVARETHASVNLMTAELAALSRQQVVLDRQLERYNAKLEGFRSGRHGGAACRELKTEDGDSSRKQKRCRGDADSGGKNEGVSAQ